MRNRSNKGGLMRAILTYRRTPGKDFSRSGEAGLLPMFPAKRRENPMIFNRGRPDAGVFATPQFARCWLRRLGRRSPLARSVCTHLQGAEAGIAGGKTRATEVPHEPSAGQRSPGNAEPEAPAELIAGR